MSPEGWVAAVAIGTAGLVLLAAGGWQAVQAWARQSGESTLEPEEKPAGHRLDEQQRPGNDDQFEQWLGDGGDRA